MDRFHIGDFTADPACNRLVTPGGTEVPLEPKVMEVLCALAERPGQVLTRDQLAERVWTGQFGADERLTRAISRLRKVFNETRGQPLYIETIPKRGYRLVAPVRTADSGQEDDASAGAPAARHVSNESVGTAAAAQAEGGERGQHTGGRAAADREGPPTLRDAARRFRSRLSAFPRLASAIVLAAAGAFAALIFVAFGPPRGDTGSDGWNSIAVGSMRVVGEDERDGDLHALAESLSTYFPTMLSANNFETISAATEKGTAEFTLSGNIERDGDGFDVFLRLQHSATGTVVWSHDFNIKAAPTAVMRDQVAATSALVLGCGIGFRPPGHDMSNATFRAYLRFCDVAYAPSTYWDMNRYTARLMKTDPGNPNAIAIHAYILAVSARGIDRPNKPITHERKARLDHAQELANRALETDPDNRLALTALAVRLPRVGRWSKVERRLKRANDGGWPYRKTGAGRFTGTDLAYASLLRRVGRLREAADIYRKAIVTDPFDIHSRLGFANISAVFGHHLRAEANLKRAEREFPHWPHHRYARFIMDLFHRDPADALAQLNTFSFPEATRDCYETFARARLKQETNLDTLTERCKEVRPNYRVLMFSCLGDVNRAYAAALGEYPPEAFSTDVFFQPCTRELRLDPRFWPLMARFGLLDYWLETDNWPDFCHRKNLPFDCRKKAIAARKERSNSFSLGRSTP